MLLKEKALWENNIIANNTVVNRIITIASDRRCIFFYNEVANWHIATGTEAGTIASRTYSTFNDSFCKGVWFRTERSLREFGEE